MAGILAGLLGSFPTASGAYELISTVLVTSTSASVTISSIPTDYTHLQIRWVARTNRADYQDTMSIRTNNRSSNNTTHNLKGSGSAITSAVATAGTSITQSQLFDMFSTNEVSGAFGAGIIDILDYNNPNKVKTIKMLSGAAGGTQAKYVGLTSGFNTTAEALTSIRLASRNNSNFVAGTRISLYGIKG